MSSEDGALRLLSSFEWKPMGKQLIANGDFWGAERQAIVEDLGKEGVEGIGLQFIGTKAYISKAAENIFKIEGLPLHICKEALAR